MDFSSIERTWRINTNIQYRPKMLRALWFEKGSRCNCECAIARALSLSLSLCHIGLWMHLILNGWDSICIPMLCSDRIEKRGELKKKKLICIIPLRYDSIWCEWENTWTTIVPNWMWIQSFVTDRSRWDGIFLLSFLYKSFPIACISEIASKESKQHKLTCKFIMRPIQAEWRSELSANLHGTT